MSAGRWPVRRITSDTGNWEYFDKQWTAYAPLASGHLEAAQSIGYATTGVAANGMRYLIDFRRMRQRNMTTNFEREIRRRPVPSAPPLPPPAPRIDVSDPEIECTADARARELTCAVCMDDFDNANRAYAYGRCGTVTHAFHMTCIRTWLGNGGGRCPVCRVSLGIMTGTQPPGTMQDDVVSTPLPGFTGGTRRIMYHFPDGVQGSEHPNPGQPYKGTSRTAFLPVPDGDTAFALLKIAFDRRLIFRVGQSITTGKDNCVVWAGLHHKTSAGPGPFGYPDPNYLVALLTELRHNGITPDDLPAPPPSS